MTPVRMFVIDIKIILVYLFQLFQIGLQELEVSVVERDGVVKLRNGQSWSLFCFFHAEMQSQ